MANEQITQIAKINQIYVTDFLTYLTYLIQKSEADDEEYKFQEMLRKAQSGRH